jgi:hypothetical protein
MDFELMINEEASGAPIYKARPRSVLSRKVRTSTSENVTNIQDAQQCVGVFK